jgi:hypothetical protein
LIWLLLTSEAAELVPTWLRVTAAVGYVLFGVCTGIVQSFVVRTNMTGRFNVVTRGVITRVQVVTMDFDSDEIDPELALEYACEGAVRL